MCEVFYWGFDVGFKDVEVFEFVVEYSWMAPQTSTMMVMRGFTSTLCFRIFINGSQWVFWVVVVAICIFYKLYCDGRG